jgi:hypothetical protein
MKKPFYNNEKILQAITEEIAHIEKQGKYCINITINYKDGIYVSHKITTKHSIQTPPKKSS